MSAEIQISQVYKSYARTGDGPMVLQGLSLSIKPGEFVAIVGPSGNGKSTLLNLMTGIDRPTCGKVRIDDADLHKLSEEQLARWRRTNVGIVFQFFQLLPSLNLLQNVLLPMDFAGLTPKRERRTRALALLDQVGLADVAGQLPSRVSGGQQQRAAIARALANDPPLLVADEPTGNLDAATAAEVFALFAGLSDLGKTLVMVTHNDSLAAAASRQIEIRCGQVFRDSASEAI